jgi:predicted enzyme related to lactoylglutathione lyase
MFVQRRASAPCLTYYLVAPGEGVRAASDHIWENNMRRAITAILGLATATWMAWVQGDVTVLAVRIGAEDVVALAKFYDTAFGLKEIDRVGEPPTEIIMRYGATVAAAKAGTSPEFLVQRREPSAPNDPITHAIFRVSDVAATVAAAKAAGATMKDDVVSVPIGGMPVKIAMLVDPDGNMLELMELPKGAEHLPHP